jgi:hypothetical protein
LQFKSSKDIPYLIIWLQKLASNVEYLIFVVSKIAGNVQTKFHASTIE